VSPADKAKGTRGHDQRQGLGRLRRANRKEVTRIGGIENLHEDDDFTDGLVGVGKRSHQGESLLARFNRLAGQGDDADAGSGQPGDVVGFAGNFVLVRPTDAAVIGGPDIATVICTVRQVLKKRIAGVKNPLCVGDHVRWLREAGKDEGVVTAVLPRRNQLERADPHNRSLIHVFAANIDRLVVVASLGAPELKPALIDRYLVIAAANAIPAVVAVNKADCGDAGPTLELYRALGFTALSTIAAAGPDDPGVVALRDLLRNQTCVVAGQSGVGKSSLVNALAGGVAPARVGAVAVDGFGRHTTTSAQAYALAGGIRIVDTPGIRSCTITGLDAQAVGQFYPELARVGRGCRFNDCRHRNEPDCAVIAAVNDGTIAVSRYISYLAILDEDLGLAE